MVRRALAVAIAVVLAVSGTAAAAAARPTPTPHPLANGVTRSEALQLEDSGPVGDCANTGVHCKPDLSGSCTGNTSQSTPPATIRVYVPSDTDDANHIASVPFETYVENVLPNEWADSWDGDALKAGAVAITSYTWYWATHFGGYIGTDPTDRTACFDVTDDDVNFQNYVAKSAQPNSTSKVQQVFPTAIRLADGSVKLASYFSALDLDTYDITHPATYDRCGEDADGTFLSQSGSQTCNQDSTANKWPVILKLYYGQGIQLATTAQLRTQHDFQYLHRSTRVTFANGVWTVEDGYPTAIHFGAAGDLPVVNTTGDGFARVGVYRPSNSRFYLGSPTGGVVSSVAFGAKGDVPVAAQYQSNTSPTQLAVFRPSTAVWYFAKPTGGVASSIQYGAKGDIPVPGVWSGYTTDSVAVFRPSTGRWYIRGAATSIVYGKKGDIPIPADYDGNGTTDIAVYRPSTHQFYVRGHAAVQWGVSGDVPVTGDFTGDGKADLVVYRPSTHTWYVRGSATVQAVAAGTPIGKAPYQD